MWRRRRQNPNFRKGRLLPLSALVLLSGPFASAPLAAEVVTKLGDFEGVEEPELRYIVATGKFVADDYMNIKDVAPGTVRMTRCCVPSSPSLRRSRCTVTRTTSRAGASSKPHTCLAIADVGTTAPL